MGKKKIMGQDYMGVLWECCNVYGYAYKNKLGTGFYGSCPKCGARIFRPIEHPHLSLDSGDKFYEIWTRICLGSIANAQ